MAKPRTEILKTMGETSMRSALEREAAEHDHTLAKWMHIILKRHVARAALKENKP